MIYSAAGVVLLAFALVTVGQAIGAVIRLVLQELADPVASDDRMTSSHRRMLDGQADKDQV